MGTFCSRRREAPRTSAAHSETVALASKAGPAELEDILEELGANRPQWSPPALHTDTVIPSPQHFGDVRVTDIGEMSPSTSDPLIALWLRHQDHIEKQVLCQDAERELRDACNQSGCPMPASCYCLEVGLRGRVYIAHIPRRIEFSEHGFVFALKVISKEVIIREGLVESIRKQINVCRRCRHPNILRLYSWLHHDNYIFLYLELLGLPCKRLDQVLQTRGIITEREALQLFSQAAQVTQYLHSRHMMLGSIKLSHFLVSDFDGSLKFADFSNMLDTAASPEAYAADVHGLADFLASLLMFVDTCSRERSAWLRDLMSPSDGGDQISLDEVLQHPWLRMHSSLSKTSAAGTFLC